MRKGASNLYYALGRITTLVTIGPLQIRILFFGMSGTTSATVLAALLGAGFDVCGVIVAAGRFARETRPEPIMSLAPAQIPLLGADPGGSIADIAHAHGIPAFELRRADASETLQILAELQPDVACVACFPLRIPPTLLALPRHGFLNLHPALLPRHRGSEPLFWTFRAGEHTAGATIHFMDEQFDTGDIVMQAPVELPDGISGAAAERMCAALGGKLMVAALGALRDGTLVRRPQPPGGSYERWPAPDDWRISTDWPARRAYNFMRGTAEWGQPYRVTIGTQELTLSTALGYNADATLGVPYVEDGDHVRIQFTPGVLWARLG
jgi:methionyl-tRNA formyltransferase